MTMTRYEGTKRLQAQPMTLGAYNDYRGWTLPVGEDPAKPGYLVEYEDGGAPNDSRHAGYISWSPADVFERHYHPLPTDFRDRVLLERKELDERITKLRAFIDSEAFVALETIDKELLQEQCGAMADYRDILDQRMERFAPAVSSL